MTHSIIRQITFFAGVLLLTSLADPAFAGAGGGGAGGGGALFDSGTNFLNSLETLLTGTWARLLAIIAVVFVGIAFLLGRMQWGMAAAVAGGIILVMGAPTIVDGITGSI